MSESEALRQLSQECPRKIMGLLHARGEYLQCTCGRFPGKVLCFAKDSVIPEDCVLTEAQAHFHDREEADAQAAG